MFPEEDRCLHVSISRSFLGFFVVQTAVSQLRGKEKKVWDTDTDG
jgi:hypothetical protein